MTPVGWKRRGRIPACPISPLQMASVLITRGAGFFGSHLAHRRLDRSDEVQVVVVPNTRLDRLGAVADRVAVHKLSLAEIPVVGRRLRGAARDLSFHFATATPKPEAADCGDLAAAVKDEPAGLAILVQAAAGSARPLKTLLRTGSPAEYGFSGAPAVETQREWPESVYAAHLVAGMHLLHGLQPRLRFPAMTAHLALLYGPGQSEAFFVADAIRRGVARRPIGLLRPHDRRDLGHSGPRAAGTLSGRQRDAGRHPPRPPPRAGRGADRLHARDLPGVRGASPGGRPGKCGSIGAL